MWNQRHLIMSLPPFLPIFNKMERQKKHLNINMRFLLQLKRKILFESFSRSSILLEIVEYWPTFLKFEGPPLNTPPVFRVVLLHSELNVWRLFGGSVHVTFVTELYDGPWPIAYLSSWRMSKYYNVSMITFLNFRRRVIFLKFFWGLLHHEIHCT